jgi:hypothetical protein
MVAMETSKKPANTKIIKIFKYLLKLSPYFFFIPICNLLYKAFVWIPEYLREYAFYLRVPIISAILIFLLFPLILNTLLRNVLIMSKWQQVSLGIIAILLAGRSIVVVANAILENAPTRFGIAVVPTFIYPSDYVCSAILGLPLIWCIISQTYSQKNLKIWSEAKTIYKEQLVNDWELLWGFLLGFFSAWGLFFIDKLFLTVLEAFKILISALFLAPLQWLGLKSMELGKTGYFYRQDDRLLLASGHLAGLSFFLIALILFFAVGFFFRPNKKSSQEKGEAPIIIYMMAFLAIVVPILATMTFALDLSRFPVILTAICFVAVSYSLWDVDYKFRLAPFCNVTFGNQAMRSDFKTAVEERLKFQDNREKYVKEGRTLVVVTASGGGIQAAGWTAQVLAGLQNWLGEDFTKSIGLISSVSGGSVGSLFFVDYCEEDGAIASNNLKAVVQDAVQDGLDTMGWGLVYRDLGNIVGLPWLSSCLGHVFKISDRGEALEYSWQNTKAGKDLPSKILGTTKAVKDSKSKILENTFVTFDDWGTRALAGKIPIPVFNTTLVEDGRRMLFSPMTFSQSKTDLTIDSNTLYPGYNMRAVTAARLSATFPYVSPTSRNEDIDGLDRNYHIVDGGYFDNSGIITAVNWLDNNMDTLLQQVNVKRLILLEIEAFEQQKFDSLVPGRGGFLMAFLAPIFTLLNVKTASLVIRNQQEIDLLIKQYRSKLDEAVKAEEDSNVQHIRVEFPSSKYHQPLSWKLAPSEKYALEEAWEGIKQEQAQEQDHSLQKLQRLWHKVWGFPKPEP